MEAPKCKPEKECRFCPYCETEIAEASFPYCRVCQVTIFYCPKCRQPVPRKSRVCPRCGAEIKG
jgi:hypothetical protein